MNLDRWLNSTRIARAPEGETGAAAPTAETPAAVATPAADSAAPVADTTASSSPASPLASADSSKRDGAPTESASSDATKTPGAADAKPGDAPPPGGADGDKKPDAGEADGKKPEASKPADGKAEGAEAAADKKEGQEGEAKPDAEAPAPKPAYEAYTLPENFKVDDARLAQFNDILGEAELSGKADHATMQGLGQKLMDLYASEAQRIANDFQKYQVDTWNRHLESQVSELKADAQYGGNRIDTSLGNAKYILEQFGGDKAEQAAFMAKLDRSGISSSIEFVKMLNRIHERYREPSQSAQPNLPTPKTNAGPGARGWYDNVDAGKA